MSITLKAGAVAKATETVLPLDVCSPAKITSGRRNVPIDILRGYCILMMIASHTGASAYITLAFHPMRFVSGAEGFVFLSGLVLGMVYRRKLDAAPPINAYRAIWKRASLIWTVHCVTVLLALFLNNRYFHYADIPDTSSMSLPHTLWLVASLKLQPGHALNILPMYVFLLGAAPLFFEMMRRGKTLPLVLASATVFLYSQWHPEIGAWVDPICGNAFPIPAWQAVFVAGLCIGYHKAAVRSAFFNRGKWFFVTAVAIWLALAVGTAVQTPTFQFYDHAAWDAFLWERHPLRFGRVLLFFLSVSVFYMAAKAWWYKPRAPKLPLVILATLGKNSLYAFLIHIAFVFALGLFQIPPDRWMLLELPPITAMIGVYLMVKYQVARRWIPN